MIIRVTRAMAESRLADVPQGKEFWVMDGNVLKNLKELQMALNDMSDDTFAYHSNDRKKEADS